MPPKKEPEHRGYPTAASLEAYRLDNSLLLECQECGAWVCAAGTDPGNLMLEKHLDRRPKPANRNRTRIIRSGRGF